MKDQIGIQENPMLKLPITYSKVASAVNNCAKQSQFAPLITMLGGPGIVSAAMFAVFQAYLAQTNKDQQFWVTKLKASITVASNWSTKWHQLCTAIIKNFTA
jgi:hypothetical protein